MIAGASTLPAAWLVLLASPGAWAEDTFGPDFAGRNAADITTATSAVVDLYEEADAFCRSDPTRIGPSSALVVKNARSF